MDIALTREERKELSELLDLAPHCFGNIPMMKFCYRKACLRLHPDKGGDAGKMQRLNELWQTFQQSIDCLRNGENAGFYSFQDEDPIYGTPHFKHWWQSQQRTGYRFEDHFPTPDGATFGGSHLHFPSSRSWSSRGSSSRHSRRSSSPSASSESTRSSVPPSRSTSPSTSSQTGGCVFGDSQSSQSSSRRSQEPPEPDLFCSETLDSSPGSPKFTGFSTTTASSSRASTSPPHGKRSATPSEGGFNDGASSFHSAGSFSSTPPKPKKAKEDAFPTDFPACLADYISHAVYSNKTCLKMLKGKPA
ncbi:303 T antigen [Sus scrofa polyomavirus 1]|uniref:303 T antigen n=1 Tax=Sus scrofa polyomavirus 1 TaxID=1680894 RepID=A0A161C612_9POLY|nr:303 T antigen [Sus scrofa polyomavirus 1]AKQ44357.1 303 T antigen [Sus scrofa polyomavirus 1]